jgi:imidazolonepropionase-like amidohydrolase
VDSIEHGYYLDEECIAEMERRGTFFVPTLALLAVYRRAAQSPHDMSPWRLRKQQVAIAAIERSFPLARSSGLAIGTGTDYFGGPLRVHGENADEPISMVREGMAPMAALQAATAGSARVIGIERHTGTLEHGKWADVIAVDGDPLAEIEALRRVAFVMKAGAIVKQPDC